MGHGRKHKKDGFGYSQDDYEWWGSASPGDSTPPPESATTGPRRHARGPYSEATDILDALDDL